MSAYEALASCYDGFTQDVQYERRARYLSRLLAVSEDRPGTILDLACGTGTLTEIFARAGHSMVGVDLSADMLAVAANKFGELPLAQRPLLLQQSMTALRLPFTVDAAFCALDSLNYLLRPEQVQRTFRALARALKPGGCFVFDVHSPEHLAELDGQVFLDETEDAYCVWRADYAPRSRILSYAMDIFRLDRDGRWQRSFEEHRERGYSVEELTRWLSEAGFTNIRVYGEFTRKAPREGEERLYFSAKKAQGEKDV